MAERRIIRLKESPPNQDLQKSASAAYIERTDGSLGEGPWRCRTDEHGFIITGNNVPLTAKPIVFLGGSFVESMYNPEPDRFVSGVERRMRERGLDVRCLNGGYSGATTLQLLNVLINKITPLVGRGGNVVLFMPQTDISIYFLGSSYWHPSDRFAPLLPPVEPESQDLPKGQSAVESVLRLAVCAAQEFGINLTLVSSPYRYAPRDADPFLSRIHSEASYDSVYKRRQVFAQAGDIVAAETRVPYLDGVREFIDSPHMFFDEVHLNDSGQQEFADWLALNLSVMV